MIQKKNKRYAPAVALTLIIALTSATAARAEPWQQGDPSPESIADSEAAASRVVQSMTGKYPPASVNLTVHSPLKLKWKERHPKIHGALNKTYKVTRTIVVKSHPYVRFAANVSQIAQVFK